jgi:hypothetical protein
MSMLLGIRIFKSRCIRKQGFCDYSGVQSSFEKDFSYDTLITGLNDIQDVSVKVVSCRGVLQEAMNRTPLSAVASKALGEVLVCGLMLGSGLKGEESLQISLVGSKGLKNIVSISDGDLKVRGMVGNPSFTPLSDADLLQVSTASNAQTLLGDGQVQVVRSHPAWKSPMNGIIELQNADIPMNIALYMAQSEQVILSQLRQILDFPSILKFIYKQHFFSFIMLNIFFVPIVLVNFSTFFQSLFP